MAPDVPRGTGEGTARKIAGNLQVAVLRHVGARLAQPERAGRLVSPHGVFAEVPGEADTLQVPTCRASEFQRGGRAQSTIFFEVDDSEVDVVDLREDPLLKIGSARLLGVVSSKCGSNE